MNRELEGGHQAQGTQPPRTSAAALESTARRRGATSNGARDGAQRGRGSVDRVSTAGAFPAVVCEGPALTSMLYQVDHKSIHFSHLIQLAIKSLQTSELNADV